MPIAYIQRTRERYAQYPPYKWVVNTEAPWTPLARPLRESRLALVSSGGFYLKDQPPLRYRGGVGLVDKKGRILRKQQTFADEAVRRRSDLRDIIRMRRIPLLNRRTRVAGG